MRKLAQALSTCANEGYAYGLKAYHGYVAYGVTTAALSLAPSRESFLEALGEPADAAYSKIRDTIPNFSKSVNTVHDFLVAKKIEK